MITLYDYKWLLSYIDRFFRLCDLYFISLHSNYCSWYGIGFSLQEMIALYDCKMLIDLFKYFSWFFTLLDLDVFYFNYCGPYMFGCFTRSDYFLWLWNAFFFIWSALLVFYLNQIFILFLFKSIYIVCMLLPVLKRMIDLDFCKTIISYIQFIVRFFSLNLYIVFPFALS